jgi:hypothetical protein
MELQRTKEWFEIRKGKFTNSELYKLMSDVSRPMTEDELLDRPKGSRKTTIVDKGILCDGGKTYVKQKIAEEIGFVPDFNNAAMEWGTEKEPSAKYWYTYKTGNKIEEVGFIQYSSCYGGSPDGWVRTSEGYGAIEVKCPYSTVNHIDHCLLTSAEELKEEFPDKYWQCIGHIIVMEKELNAPVSFCDFISFDERVDNDLGLFILRVPRNEEDIQDAKRKIDLADNYKNELKIKLGLL